MHLTGRSCARGPNKDTLLRCDRPSAEPTDLSGETSETDIRGAEGPKKVDVANRGLALMFFERSYNRIAGLMPTFIELCRGE